MWMSAEISDIRSIIYESKLFFIFFNSGISDGHWIIKQEDIFHLGNYSLGKMVTAIFEIIITKSI